MTPNRGVSTVVSTRLSCSPSHALVLIHFARLAALPCIVASITEASFGGAHLSSTCCTTHRHQDTHACEVAVARPRPVRVGADLRDPRDIREGGRRTLHRGAGVSNHAIVLGAVRR